MGFVIKPQAGTYRANWRDSADKQKAKTFRTKKEANAFLAEVKGALNKGTYVDPQAGKVRFGNFTTRWLAGRSVEARTAERTLSMLRTHLLPKWRDWPLARIDHLAVQNWVTELGRSLAPSTAAKCYGLLSMILETAKRARLIGVNPADGVKVPRNRAGDARPATISRETFFGKLLPAVPAEHRAIVATAAGTGLRWGECAGLAWGSVNLDRSVLRVVQVAVETHGEIVIRPYPKTRAGVRTVPLPAFLTDALRQRRGTTEPDTRALVFADRDGGPLRRSNFRRRVWLPSLVRAGLLGQVVNVGQSRWRAIWPDHDGVNLSTKFTTERAAVAHVAKQAAGGLRFHDLRHSYATWLITDGVPVNLVQRVMGHEQASTTLNRYTHTPDNYADRVRETFADDSLTFGSSEPSQGPDEQSTQADDQGEQDRPVKRRPPSGGDGGRPEFGSGGVEPNSPSDHGGM